MKTLKEIVERRTNCYYIGGTLYTIPPRVAQVIENNENDYQNDIALLTHEINRLQSENDRLNAEIERLKEAHPYRWYQELIDDLNSEIELMQQENMYSDDGGDDA